LNQHISPDMPHTPIVQELVDYMDQNPEMKTAMTNSFTLAYATGLDVFKEYNVHSMDDYLRFMDEYVNWMPSETRNGRNVYEHICLFYFIIDMPPVRDWQNPIMPNQKSPWLWFSEWLIRYAKEMGLWMDTPASISPETIATFYQAEVYHMQDYPVPPGGWNTFNEFFARHIDPALRPIAPGDNVVVSPADCTFDGTWAVRDPQADVDTFDVKGVPWAISQLLYDDESGTDYGPLFSGGVFTHSFLNTTDYHRQHAPVEGRVVEAKVIPGICYLEVILQASPERSGGVKLGMHRYFRNRNSKHIPQHQRGLPMPTGRNDLDAPDTPGYQFLQARGFFLIDNPVCGLVAVLPIGMAQVSSVVLSVQKGDYVQKGQEISKFQLGGSDIVMVFQKNANVKFNQEVGTWYKFGSAVATTGN
jgi:phosphatidylserine decarboxylase